MNNNTEQNKESNNTSNISTQKYEFINTFDHKVLFNQLFELMKYAFNFKGVSKSKKEIKMTTEVFFTKLLSDFPYLTFEQIKRVLNSKDFGRGFSVSPATLTEVLREASMDERSKDIKHYFEQIEQKKQDEAKRQADEKYYKEHEKDILSKYINYSFKHWQNTNEICYLNYCYKYLNIFKKAFTDRDKETAKERLTQRTQQHDKDRLAHIQKVREQAATIYRELGINEKDTPQPYNYTDETTIGKLINKYTDTTPSNQRKVKELNLTNLNNYQPTETEIKKELVLMEFEKVAERLKKKQANNNPENMENQDNKNQTNEINNNEPQNDKTNETSK